MRTRPRPLPALLGLAAGYLSAWGLYHLMLIGSCSTPAGPGETPCPPGSERYFFAVFIGMFGGILLSAAGGGWVAFLALFGGIGGAGVAAGTHGGEGWFVWFGLCFLLTPFLSLVGAVMGGAKRMRAARLLSGGVQAMGTVLAVDDTGVTINGNPRVRMRFRIEPMGGVRPPYEATKTATVPRIAIPRVGDRYPVWVDPDNPDNWMFAAHPPGQEPALPPNLRKVVELARRGSAPTMPPPQATSVDTVAELNTLNELHLTGKISADEFAARTSALLSRPEA
ncbi:MAG TPA: DUF3592 domain-containing protein [Mycobacteriales bacterium]|jgi:hypothetical protein|nr:DUF3592 domain-containing protein [Mycobacteriales bacterium]